MWAAMSRRGRVQTLIGRNQSVMSSKPDISPPPAHTSADICAMPIALAAFIPTRETAGGRGRRSGRCSGAMTSVSATTQPSRAPAPCGTASHSATTSTCSGHAAPTARVMSAVRWAGSTTESGRMAVGLIGRGGPS
jgi:hypothetical protein